jgi:hypothetical protein
LDHIGSKTDEVVSFTFFHFGLRRLDQMLEQVTQPLGLIAELPEAAADT